MQENITAVFKILVKAGKEDTLEEFKIAIRKAETLATRIRIRFGGQMLQKQKVIHPEQGYECFANIGVLVTTTEDEIKKYKKKTELYTILTKKEDNEEKGS